MEVVISIAVAIVAAIITYALWRHWVGSVFDLMKSASDWRDSLKEYSDILNRFHALHIAREEALDRHEEGLRKWRESLLEWQESLSRYDEELRKLAAPIERMVAE